MDERVKAMRTEIIHKFCRTVLWIDDEIDLQKGLGDAKPLFRAKFDEFTNAGLLCHLKEFPPAGEGADAYVKNEVVVKAIDDSVRLAHQADIVIIDWELGDGTTSVHAQKILKGILGPKEGFRFIVVLSKKDLANTAFALVDDSFKSFGDEGDLLANKTGQFLLNLKKSEFASMPLFEYICSSLQKAYPDYLHLAALEIAGRMKNYAPRWLSAIPSGSDFGILLDRGNKIAMPATKETWRKDIQDCVVSNLLEDLSTALSCESFDSLREDVLLPSNHPDGNPTDVLVAGNSDAKGTLNYAKGCLKDDAPVKISVHQYKALSNARKDPAISKVVKGVETYAEFCEKISNCEDLISRLCTGAVYEGLEGDATAIFVCITGACDCERAQSLLFLKGESLPESDSIPDYDQVGREKGGKTILRFAGKSYVFRATADSLVPKKRSDLGTKKPKGVFRCDIVNRLVGRYINYIRRIGVNQPEVARWVREEGGSDE